MILGRCTFFRMEMFQDEFIKDLRLILFVSRFRMIDFHPKKSDYFF